MVIRFICHKLAIHIDATPTIILASPILVQDFDWQSTSQPSPSTNHRSKMVMLALSDLSFAQNHSLTNGAVHPFREEITLMKLPSRRGDK